MVDKILEAIEEAAYFIEALDHSAENDAMVSKLRSALSQQPENRHWAAKDPGAADQFRCEAKAAREQLGFDRDADDISPAELRGAIKQLQCQQPGMWDHADFTGGDPDERSYHERESATAQVPESESVDLIVEINKWSGVAEVKGDGVSRLQNGQPLYTGAPSAARVPEVANQYLVNWPLKDCVQVLVRAANILLNEKDYDGHGHEFIATARDCAIAHLAAAPSIAENPIPAAKEAWIRFQSMLADDDPAKDPSIAEVPEIKAASDTGLEPCPFCGNPAREIMGLIGCEPCAIARRDATSWNRRAATSIAERPDELEKLRTENAELKQWCRHYGSVMAKYTGSPCTCMVTDGEVHAEYCPVWALRPSIAEKREPKS